LNRETGQELDELCVYFGVDRATEAEAVVAVVRAAVSAPTPSDWREVQQGNEGEDVFYLHASGIESRACHPPSSPDHPDVRVCVGDELVVVGAWPWLVWCSGRDAIVSRS